MSATLQEGQKLKRVIRVYGVAEPVIVTLTSEGLEFKVKGSKIGVDVTWPAVVHICGTPSNVPSKLHGRPFDFLNDTARRITASRVKRLDKKAKEA